MVQAINSELKEEYLHMPGQATLQRNAELNFEKYHLPDFGYGVDGVHFIFEGAPRDIFPGRTIKEFHNR